MTADQDTGFERVLARDRRPILRWYPVIPLQVWYLVTISVVVQHQARTEKRQVLQPAAILM